VGSARGCAAAEAGTATGTASRRSAVGDAVAPASRPRQRSTTRRGQTASSRYLEGRPRRRRRHRPAWNSAAGGDLACAHRHQSHQHESSACKNLVNFGPVTPELAELICERLVYTTRPKNWRIWSNIAGYTGPIFTTFSQYESALGADDRSGPCFPICQGRLSFHHNLCSGVISANHWKGLTFPILLPDMSMSPSCYRDPITSVSSRIGNAILLYHRKKTLQKVTVTVVVNDCIQYI